MPVASLTVGSRAGMACFCTGQPRLIDTVIFVDVDGVLNVGIKDPPMSPLNFSVDNVARAFRTEGSKSSMILGVNNRQQRGQAHGGSAAYSELMCDPVTGASEVLLGRLAELLRAAGSGRLVVLSSSWRMPRHRQKVEGLERHISSVLGEPFQFDDSTSIRKDPSPHLRLECIGDYVSDHCGSWQRSARVLVLEDFHIHALSGWSVGDVFVRGTADVEAYLKGRALRTHELSVMLLHTYDQWTTDQGLSVQIGSGLSQQQVEQAVKFVVAGKEPKESNGGALDLPPLQQRQQQNYSQLLWWNILSLKPFVAQQTPGEWSCKSSSPIVP
jgi:hypothetical protein